MRRLHSMGAITPTEAPARTSRGQLTQLASIVVIVAVSLVVATAHLFAHDPGLSSLDVRIRNSGVVAVLSLAASDARNVGNNEALSSLAQDSIELILDGRRLVPIATSVWS